MAQRSARHPLLALVLPLVLLGVGIWQITRITGAEEGFEARAARVQSNITRLRPLAERTPDAQIQFQGDPQSYGAAFALAKLQETETTLVRDAWVDWARGIAAWITAGAGGIALLAAVTGLLSTSIGARRGRASRAALVSGFRGVIRMLPPLLGCVAVATAIATTAAVLFEIGGTWFLESVSTGEIKLVFAGLCLAGAAIGLAVGSVRQLRRALDAFTPHPFRVLGRAVAPADAPGLWAFLGDVAARQGAAPPDHIVLGLTEGFYVTSSDMRLLPEERVLSGQTLYLPAPLLPMMSRGEIEAVVAHELAHFTGEDTAYSKHFLPLFASMGRTLEAVGGTQRTRSRFDGALQPASSIADHVLTTFRHTVSHWSRQRELEADLASLRAGRGRDAATALIRSGIGMGHAGRTLDDVFSHPGRADGDVVGSVFSRAGAAGFTDPARHLEDRQVHPTDSHPPTRQRIEALGIAIDDTLLAEAGRPLQDADVAFTDSLFNDWAGLTRQLGADLLAVAVVRDRERGAALQQAAAAFEGEVAFHERTALGVWTLGVSATILLLCAAGAAWLALGTSWLRADEGGEAMIALVSVVCLAAMGLGIAALAASRHRRGRAGPFLTVTADGVRIIGLAAPVPWSDVDGIQVITGRAFITRFTLTPHAVLPDQTAYRWSIKLDRGKRTIALTGLVPYGIKPQPYLDVLNRALRSFRARLALSERDSDV